MFALKIQVVKRPDTDAIYKRMLDAVAAEYQDFGRFVEKELAVRVDDWQEKPTFYHQVNVKPGLWKFVQLHRSQTEGGKRYNWVRLGTKGPYPITPRQASILRFRVPNQPKTLAPGQSLPGGPEGVVFSMEVQHPGIKPRNEAKGFPGEVANWLIKDKTTLIGFVPRTRRAVRKVLQSR